MQPRRLLLPRQRTTSLVVDDAGFEKVALLLEVDHLAHPRERVFLVREERLEADLPQIERAYRAGYMALGNTLAQTPWIEGRGSNETTGNERISPCPGM